MSPVIAPHSHPPLVLVTSCNHRFAYLFYLSRTNKCCRVWFISALNQALHNLRASCFGKCCKLLQRVLCILCRSFSPNTNQYNLFKS